MKKSFFAMVVFFVFFILAGLNQSEAGDPYILGYQTDLAGPGRTIYAPLAEGFRLYIDLVNDRGGINGHPVKIIYEDDKSSPATAGAIAEKFITKDNVLAILGLGFSRSHPPALKLAMKSGVPLISGYTAIMPLFGPEPSKGIFSVGVLMNPKANPQGYGNAFISSKIHPGGRLALTTFNPPGARVCNDWGEAWGKKLGMKVVFRDEWPIRTQDFTPWLVKIAKAKPDIMTSTVGGATYIPLLRQMEKHGLEKLDLLMCDATSEGDLVKGIKQLSVGNGENVLWFSRYASALDPQRPKEFENIAGAMKKFGHQHTISSLHAMGWTMGRVMESALKKAGWPCTRAQLITALEKTDLDTKGLSGGPIRWTPKDHYGATWWKVYRWDAKAKNLKPVLDWYKIDLPDIMGKVKIGK